MLTEDDGAGGWVHWCAVHLLFRHGVQLLCLCSQPIKPIAKLLELAPREAAQGLLRFSSEHSSIQRSHHQGEVIMGHRIAVRVN